MATSSSASSSSMSWRAAHERARRRGSMTVPVEARLTAEDLGHVHLVGIGGVGMSGLARLLLTRGIPVSGSELKEWPALAGLTALGATIHMRHEPSNLDGIDTVVFSSA